MYKNEKGISLIILTITVVILIIISGIVINEGVGEIENVQQTSIKTNLLLIQARGKEYVEKTNYNIGTGEKTEEEKNSIKAEYLKGSAYSGELPIQLKDNQEAYALSSDDMNEMGLQELSEKSNEYIMLYNIADVSVDVLYIPGVDYNNEKLYTLSSIEEAEGEQ